jgi:pyruvate carboxylase subunit B
VVVTALMPGLIIEIAVKEGDSVKKGQGLLIIEAMKMQNELKSPKDGIVKKIIVKKGQTVNNNDKLIVIE